MNLHINHSHLLGRLGLCAAFSLATSQFISAQTTTGAAAPHETSAAGSQAPSADNDNYSFTLPAVVVTETTLRSDEDILNLPQTVTILDSQEIAQRQASTPAKMLQEEPGVWAVSVAAQGSPIIRGQIGNRVLYLWDGIRINNGALFAGPNGFFNQFPIGAVDRMEVVHGAGSVQYGSDAIGGVINIIPKKGAFTDEFTIGGDVYSRYGSVDNEDTQVFDLRISDKQFSLAAGVSGQNVGNYHGAGKGELSPTGFKALGGYFDLALKPVDNQVIRLSWIQNERDDVGYYGQSKLNPSGYPRITDPLERRGILKLDYTLTDLAPWSSEMKFYGYYQYYKAERDRNVETPPTYTSTATLTDQNVLGAGAQNITTLGKFRFIYGLDYRSEDLASALTQLRESEITGASSLTLPAGNTPDGTYDVFDTFLTTEFRPVEPLLLSAGVRFENTHINSHPTTLDVIPNAGYTVNTLKLDKTWQSVTWDVGVVYNLTKEWDLTADINTAFRTPTYSDLFSAGPPVYSSKTASVPNPTLDPEKSITYEIGPRFHNAQWNSSLTAYWTQLEDVITSGTSGTVVIPGQGTFIASRNSNSGEGYVAGIEFAASYRPSPGWTIFSNATYTYGQDTSADQPLRFIPPLNGTVGVRYESLSGRWWAEVAEVLVAKFDRPAPGDLLDSGFSMDPALGSPNTTNNPPYRADFHIPGYALTNLRGGYKVWVKGDRSLDLTLDINNLFNARYREVYAQQQLVAPGIGVVIGARLTF